MKYNFQILLFLSLLIFEYCQKQKTENVVARVGSATLSMEEVTLHIDTTRGNLSQQVHDYVSYWINNELIYQEAQRKGFENSDEINRQLNDVKQQLVIQAFLNQQEFYDSSAINELVLREYFNSHNTEFYTREDIIKLNIIAFDNREKASTFAAAVSRSNDWEGVVKQYMTDTNTSSVIISFKLGQYFTQNTIFPPELWKVAASTSLNDVTFPVKTEIGYFVLQPTAKHREGTLPDFEFVKDEVGRRLVFDLKKIGYNELIDKLRKQYKVEMFLNGDTLSNLQQ